MHEREWIENEIKNNIIHNDDYYNFNDNGIWNYRNYDI